MLKSKRGNLYGWGTITCKTTIPTPRVKNRVKRQTQCSLFTLLTSSLEPWKRCLHFFYDVLLVGSLLLISKWRAHPPHTHRGPPSRGEERVDEVRLCINFNMNTVAAPGVQGSLFQNLHNRELMTHSFHSGTCLTHLAYNLYSGTCQSIKFSCS